VIEYRRGRTLDAQELEAVTRELSQRLDLWNHLVRHEPGKRVYEQLWRDQHLAAWVICWMAEQDTGFHDHDLSSGAVTVVTGAVREQRLTLGAEPLTRVFEAGKSFSFAASDIHRVEHWGSGPAVTVHAYSPPLWRMGSYSVGEDGSLARHSMSYAEELRPLTPGVGLAA
jgi:predicted metal-dependent enzyme (double-stranded beta helix superfamily)